MCVTSVELEVEGNVLGRDEGQKRASGKGAVDSQHGTGVEGSSHPCSKGYQPNLTRGFFLFLL